MEQLLEWLDGIPFTRPKRNITRDFSDGVFVAEIMKIYFPELVHIHNYPPVSAKNAKFSNWKTLNCKAILTQKKSSKNSNFRSTPTTSKESSKQRLARSKRSSLWSTPRSKGMSKSVKLKTTTACKVIMQLWLQNLNSPAKYPPNWLIRSRQFASYGAQYKYYRPRCTVCSSWIGSKTPRLSRWFANCSRE